MPTPAPPHLRTFDETVAAARALFERLVDRCGVSEREAAAAADKLVEDDVAARNAARRAALLHRHQAGARNG